ncbi:TorD/DmsD family molecular chaperone [Chloroflexus sp.]|uniref:TorD/DmsD family molecular chaperone n=1 Tax=Chloroflexus sp. TaxID=1904827 RepID=UPI00404B1B4D
MNDTADLVARQTLADVIGRLLIAPPSAQPWAEAVALPELATVMTDQPESLAVAYEQTFGRNVYPYESLYRDEELMLNTAAADQVAAFYATCGFTPPQTVGAPDHLGVEFLFLARLIATEAAALADGDSGLQHWAHQHAASFLSNHLAVWVPVWAHAVQRIPGHPLYQTLATLAVEFIESELERLQPVPSSSRSYIPLATSAASPETDDLNTLIRHLITPVHAGIFFSRADCSQLARRLGFSIPIGDRFTMMRTLFETAGEFEQADGLIVALQEMMSAEAQRLSLLIDGQAAWQPFLAPWIERLERSQRLIST